MIMHQKCDQPCGEIVELHGHIIDSLVLAKILDDIVSHGGNYEIHEILVGHGKADPSHARIEVMAPTDRILHLILERIKLHGATSSGMVDCSSQAADQPGCFPEGFYCTTNLPTWVRLDGKWLKVMDQEMDCGILLHPTRQMARCVPMAEVYPGDMIVTGREGVRITSPTGKTEGKMFGFMASDVSAEKSKVALIHEVAEEMIRTRNSGEKILLVLGPVVVHTGAVPHICSLIRAGFVDCVFAGNALATHDIELAICGTSLGINIQSGMSVDHGHENHLRTINTIRRCGSIERAVETGLLKKGIMHDLTHFKIPFVLAGSVRDDGPLPDVVPDVLQAQKMMREKVHGVGFCLMIGSLLNSIATGNLLSADVRVACVDIQPGNIIKLKDRGTSQIVGIVSDAEPFLRELIGALGL